MTRMWVLVLVMSATALAQTERGTTPEQDEHGPRLRTFIGGYVSGGFLFPTFHVGYAGIAGDVGVQVNRTFSTYVALRASSSGVTNWAHLAPTFEWSNGSFSLGAGVGAAISVNLIPTQLGGIRPAVVVPLTFGFSTAPVPDGARMGSVRFNIELAFVWNPTQYAGIGGMLGVSIGRQSR
ncbi:MAG: hypothetical protein ACO1OB_22940 [Archangium sp.]